MRKSKITVTGALLAVALVSGCGSSYSSSGGSKASSTAKAAAGESGVTVKTASLPAAGGTVLVNSAGLTLYHLSAEQNGKFICTGASCEALWHPLVAGAGRPGGVESLGTVKRPDGSEQVTYKGMPLYTFAQDTKPGDAKGQGFKDVGTWMAVAVGSSSGGGGAATSTEASQPSGGRYGY